MLSSVDQFPTEIFFRLSPLTRKRAADSYYYRCLSPESLSPEEARPTPLFFRRLPAPTVAYSSRLVNQLATTFAPFPLTPPPFFPGFRPLACIPLFFPPPEESPRCQNSWAALSASSEAGPRASSLLLLPFTGQVLPSLSSPGDRRSPVQATSMRFPPCTTLFSVRIAPNSLGSFSRRAFP